MSAPVSIQPERQLPRGLPPMQMPPDSKITSSVTRLDLQPTEIAFIAAMRELNFGRFEYVQIRAGELVLDPWPVTVRDIKFATSKNSGGPELDADELRLQIVEFFEYVRSGDAGEIRTLEIRHGLPFSMEVDLSGAKALVPAGVCRG